jgi:hypothetical protein
VKLLAGIGLGRGSKAVIALMGVIAFVTPILALLKGSLPLPAMLLLLASSWLLAYTLVDRFILQALRGAARLLEDYAPPLLEPASPEEPEAVADLPGPEIGDDPFLDGDSLDSYSESYDGDMNEAMLLTWGFAKSLIGEIAGRGRSVYVAAHDEGVIYYIYPENYGDDVYKLVDKDAYEDVAVAKAGERSYLVILSEDVVESLYQMALNGSGERLVVETNDQLELIYAIARSMAKAHLGDSSDAYIDYVAYKAVVKLALKGVIAVPKSMLERIPNIDSDTMSRIKRQIDEELGSLGTGSTSPSTA